MQHSDGRRGHGFEECEHSLASSGDGLRAKLIDQHLGFRQRARQASAHRRVLWRDGANATVGQLVAHISVPILKPARDRVFMSERKMSLTLISARWTHELPRKVRF